MATEIFETELSAKISVLTELKPKTYKWPELPVHLMIPFEQILNEVIVKQKNLLLLVELGRTLTNYQKFCMEQENIRNKKD